MILEQKQLSKQTQLIDQNFSNEIMLNALAALENLALFKGYNGHRIFDYYSGYANKKNEQELVNAVILQLEIFRTSHYNYALIYSDYNFPKNLTKEQIIMLIDNWKQYIDHRSIRIFYDEMINYLQGNSNISGISEIIDNKKKQWGPTSKEDLKRIARGAPYFNGQMNKKIDKVKQAYKNGNYEIIANLNQKQSNNMDMEEYNNNEQQFEKLKNEFQNHEKEIESFFNKLINNPSLQKKDYNSLLYDFQEYKNLVQCMNPEGDEIKNKIKNFTAFKENIPKGIPYDINILIQLCDDIINLLKQKLP